jgi:hypothetical protein
MHEPLPTVCGFIFIFFLSITHVFTCLFQQNILTCVSFSKTSTCVCYSKKLVHGSASAKHPFTCLPQQISHDITVSKETRNFYFIYYLSRASFCLFIAAYVSKDGLVCHHWKRGPLDMQTLYAPVQGNARAKKWEWVGRGVGGGYGRLLG